MSPRHAIRSRLEGALDFLRLMDEKGREDRLFLLASGVAFNLLLALIPLMVVTIVAAAFFLERSGEQTVIQITQLLGRLVPVGPETVQELQSQMTSILSAAPTALSIGTVAFVWLSTRLFGALRAALSEVFDIEDGRTAIAGKLFDMRITVVAALFITAYFTISAYVALATTQGMEQLVSLGIRSDVMGAVEYNLSRLVAFLFVLLTFFLLYRYMPYKGGRNRTALVAATFTSVMIELARIIIGMLAANLYPSSLYTGLVAVAVAAVVWSYYVAVIFLLGGEVAQTHDLLRARRIQRVVFEQVPDGS